MSTWTTPKDIKAIVRKAWDRGDVLCSHLSGTPQFPKIIPLARPETRELGDRFADVRAWAADLERDAAKSAYEIEWEEINNRQVGRNRVPRRVVVRSPSDAAALIGKAADLRRWEKLASDTLSRFPSLREWLLRRPLSLLEHGSDWERVLAVLAWFKEHPRPGVYVRQIDVAGVDTKFIEARRALLIELLDLVLPSSAIRADAVGAKAFESRYGLRPKPARVRFRHLDASSIAAGLADIETPVTEFARRPLQVEHVVVVENEINFLSFPRVTNAIVIFGGGYSVDKLEQASWLGSRRLFYWGDLDTHGFAMLDMLRACFPDVRSFLMDRETLLSHRGLWVGEDEQRTVTLERLTPDERALYDDLRTNILGNAVRLEQERIAYGSVVRAAATIVQPSEASKTWVDGTETRNWLLEDPVLDWLNLHGAANGFQRDDQSPGYDSRTDFHLYLTERNERFRDGFVAKVAAQVELATISSATEDEQVAETLAALRQGAAAIAGGRLRNERRRTTAAPHLLMRTDVWSRLFPDTLAAEEARAAAHVLGLERAHYVPITVIWRGLDIDPDGRLALPADQLPGAVSAWFAADALTELQGYAPHAFLVGRPHRDSEDTSFAIARVEYAQRTDRRGRALAALAHDATNWVRRLRDEGAHWQVLPQPSVPELYPHARHREDAPWHGAKQKIALALEELTLLPGMNPHRRRVAHDAGIRRWSDPNLSATIVGLGSASAVRFELVLSANRSPTPDVFGGKGAADGTWRVPAPIEFFVDFETSYDLADDRVRRIVQVGCGHLDREQGWTFRQWTVEAFSDEDERRVLDAWIAHMHHLCASTGTDPAEARICHWSAAERSTFDTAFDAARVRHEGNGWPRALPWFDVLERVIRAVPFAVTGAFDFGLKSIARAMHQAGFISASWESGSIDGLAAMVGMMRLAESGVAISTDPLAIKIGRYNETDCRAMMEVLHWLRRNC